MALLTMKEEVILSAIVLLDGSSGGAPIRNKVIELSGKEIVYGTLYNLMEKLIHKGYVTTGSIDPSPVQGGKRKTLYSITSQGRQALQETLEVHANIKERLSELGNA